MGSLAGRLLAMLIEGFLRAVQDEAGTSVSIIETRVWFRWGGGGRRVDPCEAARGDCIRGV